MPETMRQYDCIILAGYTREDTPLSQASGQPIKALLPIDGRPMIRYVVDALAASGVMRRLVLVGLDPGLAPALALAVPVTYLPNQGGIVENSLAALDVLPETDAVLFCSTDIPLLTPEAVRDFVARCEESGADLCYPIIRREVMEARYKGSGRSFRNLADGSFCGGDLYRVRPALFRAHAAFARSLTSHRKSAWGLAKVLGAEVILRFLFHRLHVRDLEKRVAHILNCTCKAIPILYPELGMDVDKPQHLEVVLRALHEGKQA